MDMTKDQKDCPKRTAGITIMHAPANSTSTVIGNMQVTAMCQSVVCRAVPMFASGPFGLYFFPTNALNVV
ncbi:hypothetical protein KIN20_033016 [Parelaphostrongylus tenuis]|uniref:Uncharacterized protein n=1 Tax=Parelaphostrongylus tenuis TaxID=148309 RepID=A0AAD5R9M7_PARTN|nr:hypothetical protein KIN20_033016 [Parelaphostrongylus tenuis]